MSAIKWLKDVSIAQAKEVGAKAALLGTASQNWDVPIGFVVMPHFFQRFLQITNLDDKLNNLISVLDYDHDERLQQVANEIQKLLLDTNMPDTLTHEIVEYYKVMTVRQEESAQTLLADRADVHVAVRTSVDLPFDDVPGTFGMYMNLKGQEKVIRAVQACWASRFTLKALKILNGIGMKPLDLSLSVIVQKMVSPTKMGDIFTSSERSEMEYVIDAYWGLRELSEPDLENADSYYYDPESKSITKTNVRAKVSMFVKDIDTGNIIKEALTPIKSEIQILDEVQIEELASMATRLQKKVGTNVHITWAYVKDKLYVLQLISIDEPTEANEMYEDENLEKEIEQADFTQPEVPTPEPVKEPEREESATPDEQEEATLVQSYREQVSFNPVKQPEQLLDSAFELAGHAVGNAFRALTVKLKGQYIEQYNTQPPEYLHELLDKINVTRADELKQIYVEYTEFMRDGKNMSARSVANCLEICSSII